MKTTFEIFYSDELTDRWGRIFSISVSESQARAEFILNHPASYIILKVQEKEI